MKAGEEAQWVKQLLWEGGDPSSDPQSPHKRGVAGYVLPAFLFQEWKPRQENPREFQKLPALRQNTDKHVSFVSVFWLFFEIGPYCGAQAGPQLHAILLPQSLKSWDYRHTSACLALLCCYFLNVDYISSLFVIGGRYYSHSMHMYVG